MKSNSKVLIIGLVWPEPETTAAGNRIMQLLRFFSKNTMEVHFASSAVKTDKSAALEEFGISCHSIKINDPGFNEWIGKLSPNFVVFDRFVTEEQFSWRVRESCSSAIRILDTEDLHFLREARRLALAQNEKDFKPRLLNEVALRELASVFRSDLSLLISEYEYELLSAHFNMDQGLLHYIPYMLSDSEIHTGSTCPSYSQRKGFMTMGNWRHGPNRDSIFYLRQEIWPGLRKMMPDAEIHVYGAYGSEKDLGLHEPSLGFYVRGWAESKEKAYSKHRVCLAPLRYGAGLKGKLIDSMRFGMPSVTTSIGSEGIAGGLPWSGFVADNAEEFAELALELYINTGVWRECQLKGEHILRERFREELFEGEFVSRLGALSSGLKNQRSKNFVGALLWHHSAQSTKYLSKWIEAKNQIR